MNNKKQVARIKDGYVTAVYESVTLAARLNGISKSGISKAINKKIKTYKGYQWEYVKGDIELSPLEYCKTTDKPLNEKKNEEDQTQQRKTTRHFDWFFRFWLWIMKGLGFLG